MLLFARTNTCKKATAAYLALNASVEAARVGDSGSGFAVVAKEIRSLADKATAASKNTAALIKETVTAVDKGEKVAHISTQAQVLDSLISQFKLNDMG